MGSISLSPIYQLVLQQILWSNVWVDHSYVVSSQFCRPSPVLFLVLPILLCRLALPKVGHSQELHGMVLTLGPFWIFIGTEPLGPFHMCGLARSARQIFRWTLQSPLWSGGCWQTCVRRHPPTSEEDGWGSFSHPPGGADQMAVECKQTCGPFTSNLPQRRGGCVCDQPSVCSLGISRQIPRWSGRLQRSPPMCKGP